MHEGQILLRLLNSYGDLLVAALVCAEGLGVPLPGETALLTAAAYAARGRLSICGVISAAAIGAVLGGTGGYWIGRSGGPPFVRRYGRWLGVDEAKLVRARRHFERHGPWTVFLGRFIALLRILAAVLAGVARMPFAKFTLFNTLGAVVWALVFGLLGYLFGRNLPRLEHDVGGAGVVLATAVAVAILIRMRRRPRMGS